MKTLFTFCSVLLVCTITWSQSPQLMSYQAVVRDNDDQLIRNQITGVQLSILQGSESGIAVYVETHSPMTNSNGLLSIEVGNGTMVSGDLSAIDWSEGPYFIKTEIDPAGGTDYSIVGANQLMSVPYALYAMESGTPGPPGEDGVGVDTTLDNGDGTFTFVYDDGSMFTTSDLTGPQGPEGPQGPQGPEGPIGPQGPAGQGGPFYLGQDTLDGIVFYIYRGKDGQQHGLIMSKTETTAAWQSNPSTTSADRSWDGAYNTDKMTNSPAKTWINNNFSPEWYLPSIDELKLIWQNRLILNRVLHEEGHALLGYETYWSSTEESAAVAWNYWFYSGGAYTDVNKVNARQVRAIRPF